MEFLGSPHRLLTWFPVLNAKMKSKSSSHVLLMQCCVPTGKNTTSPTPMAKSVLSVGETITPTWRNNVPTENTREYLDKGSEYLQILEKVNVLIISGGSTCYLERNNGAPSWEKGPLDPEVRYVTAMALLQNFGSKMLEGLGKEGVAVEITAYFSLILSQGLALQQPLSVIDLLLSKDRRSTTLLVLLDLSVRCERPHYQQLVPPHK